jgi:hypothetical protein
VTTFPSTAVLPAANSINFICRFHNPDRHCGLVVPGCRSRGPGSIPSATRFSEK